jgi:hypothetical protein
MAAQPKRVLLSIWQCPFNMGLRVTLWNWTEELSLLPFGLGNFPFPFHPPLKRAVHLSTVGLLKNQCVSLGSIHGLSQVTNVERPLVQAKPKQTRGPMHILIPTMLCGDHRSLCVPVLGQQPRHVNAATYRATCDRQGSLRTKSMWRAAIRSK